MKNKLPDLTRLAHIRQAGQRIANRTAEKLLSQFVADEDLQDIVVRRLTIVGEALTHISAATRQQYPSIDWRAAVGIRNFVVHEYFRVDLPTVWEAVTVELPSLLKKLEIIWQDLQAQPPGTPNV